MNKSKCRFWDGHECTIEVANETYIKVITEANEKLREKLDYPTEEIKDLRSKITQLQTDPVKKDEVINIK